MRPEPAAVVSCHLVHLAARCRQRGYTLEEVRDCIVQQHGEQLLVDTGHAAFPRQPKAGFVPPTARPTQGPGTELKRLLGKLGIHASSTCSCNARARQMDAMGCEWCEQHIDTVVGWLRDEAGKRKVPFLDVVGKVLVRRAISNARKEERRAQAAKEGEATGIGSTV